MSAERIFGLGEAGVVRCLANIRKARMHLTDGMTTSPGRRRFISPEEALGGPTTDSGDIYVFGLLIFYATAREQPVDGDKDSHYPTDVIGHDKLSACPQALRPLVHACLADNPSQRPTADVIIYYLRNRSWPPGTTNGPKKTALWKVIAAAAVVVAATVIGFALGRLHSPSAKNQPPADVPSGRYIKNEVIYQGGGWLVALTAIEVRADRTVRAEVTYRNEGSALYPSCAGYTDPGIDTLTLGDTIPVRATNTYCSDHPDWQERIPSGGSMMTYADFPVVLTANQSFILTWQTGMPVSGIAYNIRIP